MFRVIRQLTKYEVQGQVLDGVMCVVDPEFTGQLDVKLLKKTFPRLSIGEWCALIEEEKDKPSPPSPKKVFVKAGVSPYGSMTAPKDNSPGVDQRGMQGTADVSHSGRGPGGRGGKGGRGSLGRGDYNNATKSGRGSSKSTAKSLDNVSSTRIPVKPLHDRTHQSQSPVRASITPPSTSRFKTGDIVEMMVEGDDEDSDTLFTQWLPAVLQSTVNKKGFVTVRALVGYDPEDSEFDTEEQYIRTIPARSDLGKPLQSGEVENGTVVQVWYALGDELQSAVVKSISKSGTVHVSYEELELEEEVPLVYLFEKEHNQYTDNSEKTSDTASSHEASVDLDELAVASSTSSSFDSASKNKPDESSAGVENSTLLDADEFISNALQKLKLTKLRGLIESAAGDTSAKAIAQLSVQKLKALGVPASKAQPLWDMAQQAFRQEEGKARTVPVVVKDGDTGKKEDEDSDLYVLLKEYSISPLYDKFKAAANGNTAQKLLLVGEKKLVELGVPMVKARRLWGRIQELAKSTPGQNLEDGATPKKATKDHAKGDLVEVYVGEDDVMEEKDWLPGMVTSAAVDDGYEVRMLVGYDEEDATFEVEEKEVRKIPVRFGGSMDPKKVKKGSKVRVWYEQTLNAATVLSLEEIGTVRVSYEGMDLEEEVPMAYLFDLTNDGKMAATSSSSGPTAVAAGDKSQRGSMASSLDESQDLEASRRSSVASSSVLGADDLGSLLKEFDLSKLYDVLESAAGGTSAAQLVALGDKKIVALGVPKLKAKRLLDRAQTVASQAPPPSSKADAGPSVSAAIKASSSAPDANMIDDRKDGFKKLDLVEVNVGGAESDGEDLDAADQWLPAVLESDRTDDGFFEVRMLVGYEDDEALFETEEQFIRRIPSRDDLGTPLAVSGVTVGAAVRVWYAQGEEMEDATVARVTKIGTAEVTYSDLELEEEVPLAYLFEPGGSQAGDVSKRSSIASSSSVADESVSVDGSQNNKSTTSSAAAGSRDLDASSVNDSSRSASANDSSAKNQSDHLSKSTKKKFANGDLVEVYVGEDDVMEEKDWLPAMVTSAAVDDGYEVRMLVGYDEEDATFEVEEKEVRKIPVRFGGSMDPKKVKKGSKVRVWYEQTLNAATVLSLEEIGTVRVSYEGMDLEEEVPMAYLFSMRTNQ